MRVTFAIAIVAVATSCAAIHRPATTRASLDAEVQTLHAAQRATVDDLIEGLARRAVARGDHTLDLLFLSGGGQDGAYGAGFLRGWRSLTTSPMPTFDLVTGVSAGAMQSPFAVIGTQAAFDQSATLFRNAARDFAPTYDWWSWIRKTGGVVNVSRYRKTVDEVLNEQMQRDLDAEFAKDRHLVIATTDFDLGVGRLWDFAHELGATPDALPRARTILVASSSIPGIFPPVVIDGHVHADGAVVSNVLMPLDYDDYRTLAKRLADKGVTGDVTVRLWVVMNLWLSPQTTVSDPASRSGMTQRGTALLFISQQPQLIDNLTNLSRAVNADIPGLKMELHSTSIPMALSGEKGADKLFDDTWMKRLEQFGYDRAVGRTPWDGDGSVFPRSARSGARSPRTETETWPLQGRICGKQTRPYGCIVTTVNSVDTVTVPRSLMRMQ